MEGESLTANHVLQVHPIHQEPKDVAFNIIERHRLRASLKEVALESSAEEGGVARDELLMESKGFLVLADTCLDRNKRLRSTVKSSQYDVSRSVLEHLTKS